MAQSRRQFRIGEDIPVCLDVMDGDIANVTAIAARLRRAVHGCDQAGFDPLDRGRDMLVFQMPPVAGVSPGWLLVLPASVSGTLSAGDYGIDARLMIAGVTAAITRKSAAITLTDGAVS